MFHDEKLKQLENEYFENIDTYQITLDRINADIKNLEKLMNEAGVGRLSVQITPTKELIFQDGRIKYIDTIGERLDSRLLADQKADTRIDVSPHLPTLFEICVSILKKGARKQ